jgi:hypothetical protein
VLHGDPGKANADVFFKVPAKLFIAFESPVDAVPVGKKPGS